MPLPDFVILVGSNWPIYYKERLWCGGKDGFVGLVTLWTPKEFFYEKIPKNLYQKVAAIGQLYSKRGIEFIFKNIYANPKIRYLIVTGSDLSDSGNYIYNFPKYAQEILPDTKKSYIDKFLKHISIIDMRGKTVDEVFEKIKNLKPKKPFTSPKIFKEKQIINSTYTSENSIFRVEADTIGQAWIQILKLVMKFGRIIPRVHIYDGSEKVLLNLCSVIKSEDIKNPKIWDYFDFTKDNLRQYFQNFFNADRGDEPYTYGERMFSYEKIDGRVNQVDLMTQKLKSFNYNKGALITLWNPTIDNFRIRKPWRTPCLTLIQGFVLERKLFLTAYFRSNDMYGAWPLNAFALRKLQYEIAQKIELGVGDLTVISSCAFIDSGDWHSANQKIDKFDSPICADDPRGSLIVEVEKTDIILKHLSTSGEILAVYRQNGLDPSAIQILRQIIIDQNLLSRFDHAIYIGSQIALAIEAIRRGIDFIQDKPLAI